MKNKKPVLAAKGPLRVNARNPRYFDDGSGRAVYLTGSHTWENLQDFIKPGKKGIDYGEYLEFMRRKGHNFMRMWIWEHAAWMPGSEDKTECAPLPYERTGPDEALDGKPKFNLDRWNESFFELLRSRVIAAGEAGIYVSVMLFEGWSIKKPWLEGDPWRGHPYHRDNNVNGVDGDGNADGLSDIHSLEIPAVVQRQEAFIRKVVDTVNDLDNVLYEIINEGDGSDRFISWELHMLDYIHQYESGKPWRHPVGLTPSGNAQEKTLLFTAPCEWMSPTYLMDPRYKDDPPAADGSKVILNDTDHVDGQLTVFHYWVWKCLLRGQHPVFMDPWDLKEFIGESMETPEHSRRLALIRDNMGYSRLIAELMDLVNMAPRGDLASTGYCLANPGREYLVYLPEGGNVTVDLGGQSGAYSAGWFDPLTGKSAPGVDAAGGGKREFASPFGGDAVLHLLLK